MYKLLLLSHIQIILASILHSKLSREPVSTADVENVEYAKGLTNCPRGKRHDTAGTCRDKSLLLDVYGFDGKFDGKKSYRKPAYIIAHGGANMAGDKRLRQVVESARFFAKRGFVAFSVNYRVLRDYGTYPGPDFTTGKATWSSLYPAARDLKAAVRYVRANADFYGVDPHKIVVAGASAGAMDALAAFSTKDNAFMKELSVEDDPTLRTTHMSISASVQAVIMHWGAPWGLQAYRRFADSQSLGWSGKSIVMQRIHVLRKAIPAVFQIHGTGDVIIGYGNATRLNAFLEHAGVKHTLHLLPDAPHGPWNFGCNETNTPGYCQLGDKLAMDFIRDVFQNGRATPGNGSNNTNSSSERTIGGAQLGDHQGHLRSH